MSKIEGLPLQIASWNIGGAHRVDPSGKLWDSKGEDISQVIRSLGVINAKLICIQESHSRAGRVIAKEIKNGLGMQDVYDTKQNPSHIDSRYQLSLSTITSIPFAQTEYHPFPLPHFPVRLPGHDEDIPEGKQHKKGKQVSRLSNGLNVVNFQLLPGRILGFDYAQGIGAEFATEINGVLSENLPETGPLIICCDANYDETGRTPIEQVFPALQERGLQQVLPHHAPTRFTETGERIANDYCFVSDDLEVMEAHVREDLSGGLDHFPLEFVIYEKAV